MGRRQVICFALSNRRHRRQTKPALRSTHISRTGPWQPALRRRAHIRGATTAAPSAWRRKVAAVAQRATAAIAAHRSIWRRSGHALSRPRCVKSEVKVASAARSVRARRGKRAAGYDRWRGHRTTRASPHRSYIQRATDCVLAALDELVGHLADEDGWVVSGQLRDGVE